MMQSYGSFLFFPNFAAAIQGKCLIATSFPGCFRLRSVTEIKPVEPGQGNACEGKKLNSFFNAAFPLHFLIKKRKK